jgi:peptide/nickel transport system permease protein
MTSLLRPSNLSIQGITGGLILLLTLILVAFGPQLAPYDPETFHSGHRLEGPSLSFPLGTDNFGRDLLSRVLHGARPTVLFGVLATALGIGLGTLVGVMSGYIGGLLDDAIMRLMDGLMSIPNLLLALLVITALGSSSTNAALAVGIAFMPGMARITRSTTLAIRTQDYVKAAIARGEGTGYIVTREVLPNVFAPTIIEGTIRVAFAIMLGASLSFLGLGAQPPSSEWGLMVAEGRNYLFRNPWIIVGPGLAIGLVSIGFNLFGDSLRDALNPELGRGE